MSVLQSDVRSLHDPDVSDGLFRIEILSSKDKIRARLTESEVLAIFKAKNSPVSSTMVARAYGVSEKAIRDIWQGRTWAKETRHLEATKCFETTRIGRPAGSKDTKTRKTKNLFKTKTIDDQLLDWEQNGSLQSHLSDPFREDWIEWAAEASGASSQVTTVDTSLPSSCSQSH